ncbi:LCP family protein [Leptolyngbya sp. FACHB-261]|uniref:LCP family protein n=1 Tax=Leptolyngbya sp. FACHB-261 TaxID=2692806 RepID=UPI001681EF32|nr:LCP family protein [Leptolyngbya sp. FACHB-261]MBD2104201.1 LCP family protein [Leptolyngbya sp. FACHB-261]
MGSSQISTTESASQTEPTVTPLASDQPPPQCERFAPESDTIVAAPEVAVKSKPSVVEQNEPVEQAVVASAAPEPISTPIPTLLIEPPQSVASSKPRLLDWWHWKLLLSVVALLSVGAGTLLAVVKPLGGLPWSAPEQRSQSPLDFLRNSFRYQLSRPVTVLVMGIDRVPDAPAGSKEVFNGRSDTMLLLRFDPAGSLDPANPDASAKGVPVLNLLSIPRDTRVDIPGVGISKINSANAAGGPTLAAQTVSETLNGVQIDRYLRLDTSALVDLVDLLGGVRVYVPKRMRYVDQTQKLNIDLQPGWQTLNGTQAMHFARFRQDDYGDIGRVQRQQVLLKALSAKLTDPTTLARIPQVLSLMPKYLDTNLSAQELLSLAYFGIALKSEQINMVMLPGEFGSPATYGASYWLLDEAARDRVVKQFFEVEPGSDQSEVRPQELRIAIQSASKAPQAARSLADYLASQGFYNVSVAPDWPEAQSETEVLAQRGDVQGAEAIRKVLGLGKVSVQSTGDIESDVTIRVGDDWQPPQAEPTPKAEAS